MLDMGANGSAWRAGRAQPPRRADKGAGFRTARHEARGPHHFTAHPAMLSRRHLLCCGAAAGLFTSLATPARAGLLNTCQRGIPDALRPLVERTFDGLDPTQLWDVHTHLLGTGDSGSGCAVNASYTAVGSVTEVEIRGTIDTVLTKTPGSCEVEGFCPDAEFVYVFLRRT